MPTQSSKSAWIGGGRWCDGYPHGAVMRRPPLLPLRQLCCSLPTAANSAGAYRRGTVTPSRPCSARAACSARTACSPHVVSNDGHVLPSSGAVLSSRQSQGIPTSHDQVAATSYALGAPYSISNETRLRNDWYWKSAAGHMNEIQHPFARTVPSTKQPSRIPQDSDRQSRAWVTGPRHIGSGTQNFRWASTHCSTSVPALFA